eukprot:NODE_9921_length_302_cov_29.383399_g8153_i0.p4 GENE.NODE_9921_length_302_cov_29.383399_g8153_i0~~NODE_9921_length_302_cov_29.383399_g8153_i0.p4  ORF type:complete len:64 (-),score=16.70 NODE_9921_length_302_cov_29.383399_g8153_i0:78-269(-)
MGEEQTAQIDEIYQNAQASTDSVQQAARLIGQATRRGVSFRFCILAALASFSVILLGLHAVVP